VRTARFRRPGTDTGGAAAVAAGAAIGTANLLARLVALIATLVVLVIVAGIAFVVLKANMGNSVVSSIHDAAKFLVGPFDGLFKLHDHKLGVAINWGIAAVVYMFVGRLIAGLLRRY
jgi:ribose/xylose/arabinose/galactoside ABC-type transport system permease subunit